ncbi:hypothetical protein GCM10009721_42720 [Terrabacter tumescens]|uniref:Uncharacterized protein n=1 Tax=Terrabacter tumescens TaxID=60443 RepID=A0ABQ2IJJ0_9MICO|nr:hypothetical protein GCM10009721_42720 [Terrabacter tumescens]
MSPGASGTTGGSWVDTADDTCRATDGGPSGAETDGAAPTAARAHAAAAEATMRRLNTVPTSVYELVERTENAQDNMSR